MKLNFLNDFERGTSKDHSCDIGENPPCSLGGDMFKEQCWLTDGRQPTDIIGPQKHTLSPSMNTCLNWWLRQKKITFIWHTHSLHVFLYKWSLYCLCGHSNHHMGWGILMLESMKSCYLVGHWLDTLQHRCNHTEGHRQTSTKALADRLWSSPRWSCLLALPQTPSISTSQLWTPVVSVSWPEQFVTWVFTLYYTARTTLVSGLLNIIKVYFSTY